ncbi:DUF4352 domain-containing protein [Nitrosopumilus sp. K4]|uniref:DUF4352 domain-containing protein n=1 Tax=Nitrosopumilus sp. K4 TaxID=2795383 RepID=UPI001BA83390|nr:DUF4352 domain-containing protein [Nitrosopumilus sp. K4]QUC65371.1 DUF4352 domain-containing protein [Nitrosopumilus sp. K4]
MARMGLVIVIGAIIISMGVAIYAYTLYQTNYVTAVAGEPITVGPIEYVITFDGTHNGNKDTKPENIFVKIRINAKNISNEEIRISGGQFILIDEKLRKHEAVYGAFSAEDLLEDYLEPNKPVSWTTQFDIPYDEQEQLNVTIKPLKPQATVDVGSVCIANC